VKISCYDKRHGQTTGEVFSRAADDCGAVLL
jgi:hypothetical protein